MTARPANLIPLPHSHAATSGTLAAVGQGPATLRATRPCQPASPLEQAIGARHPAGRLALGPSHQPNLPRPRVAPPLDHRLARGRGVCAVGARSHRDLASLLRGTIPTDSESVAAKGQEAGSEVVADKGRQPQLRGGRSTRCGHKPFRDRGQRRRGKGPLSRFSQHRRRTARRTTPRTAAPRQIWPGRTCRLCGKRCCRHRDPLPGSRPRYWFRNRRRAGGHRLPRRITGPGSDRSIPGRGAGYGGGVCHL